MTLLRFVSQQPQEIAPTDVARLGGRCSPNIIIGGAEAPSAPPAPPPLLLSWVSETVVHVHSFISIQSVFHFVIAHLASSQG